MLKVLHVITGLESGGAETLLSKLVGRMDSERFECAVVSLTDSGPVLGRQIQAMGVSVDCLNYPRGVPHPGLIVGLVRVMRRFQPDIIQTWLYHADLIGALAHGFYRRAPLVWGLHNTELDTGTSRRLSVGVAKLNARLSFRAPTAIVCCSEAVRQDHARMGYCRDKLRVIPNGIDTAEFVPDVQARGLIRQELRLPEETPLVGLIARFDPQKDHETFFKAAGILHQSRRDVHFVLCGTGVTAENAALSRWASQAGVEERVHLLGLRRDTPRVTAALDVATCCSCSEAFALVLGEAMACGIPCVTTDLPGPVSLVGDLGRVVPVADPAALAAAWSDLLSQPEEQRYVWGMAARQRIEERFSLQKMVQGYECLYRELGD